MTPAITLTETPDAEAAGVIERGLSLYNEEQAGYKDSRALAVLVSDPDTHEVLGGILGRTSLGLCFLDLYSCRTGSEGRTSAPA